MTLSLSMWPKIQRNIFWEFVHVNTSLWYHRWGHVTGVPCSLHIKVCYNKFQSESFHACKNQSPSSPRRSLQACFCFHVQGVVLAALSAAVTRSSAICWHSQCCLLLSFWTSEEHHKPKMRACAHTHTCWHTKIQECCSRLIMTIDYYDTQERNSSSRDRRCRYFELGVLMLIEPR